MKRSRLKANPEKVRAFLARGRASDSLSRSKGLSPGRRKRRRKIPAEVRERVLSGVCARPSCNRPGRHVHHVFDVSNWPELELEEDNLLGLCPQCNWSHHWAPSGRLPRSCLPAAALALAEGHSNREVYLERTYR